MNERDYYMQESEVYTVLLHEYSKFNAKEDELYWVKEHYFYKGENIDLTDAQFLEIPNVRKKMIVLGAARITFPVVYPIYAFNGTVIHPIRNEIERPVICTYCGIPLIKGVNLTTDHLIPKSRGGNSKPINCRPSCKSCNGWKHSKTLEEWMEEISILLEYKTYIRRGYGKYDLEYMMRKLRIQMHKIETKGINNFLNFNKQIK